MNKSTIIAFIKSIALKFAKKRGVDADSIVSVFTATTTKLEDYSTVLGEEVDYLAEKAAKAISLQNEHLAEIKKAERYAGKIKAMFEEEV